MIDAMPRKASIALITQASGSANRVAAVVFALEQLKIDWRNSELAIFLLGDEDESVVLPPGDWHLLDGTSVRGGHVFSRAEVGEATVAFSGEWNSAAGT
jgi:hypothetical protein